MKRNQEEFFGEAPRLRGQYNDRRMKIKKKIKSEERNLSRRFEEEKKK